jgi:cell division septation protein DedD
MSASQDTEITLGTGKLLLIFFGLVALCAVFFAFGYNFGRSSATPALAERTSASVDPAKPVNKTGAAGGTKTSDLTFYKAVAQNDANPQLTPAQTPVAAAPSTPTDPSPSQPATAAGSPDTTTLPSASSYYVQVAAVSKQEDAEALVEALKKKQYPAFTASGSSADKLFHVQLGPYVDIKDAEIMRAKLISDGYNPILKK